MPTFWDKERPGHAELLRSGVKRAKKVEGQKRYLLFSLPYETAFCFTRRHLSHAAWVARKEVERNAPNGCVVRL